MPRSPAARPGPGAGGTRLRRVCPPSARPSVCRGPCQKRRGPELRRPLRGPPRGRGPRTRPRQRRLHQRRHRGRRPHECHAPPPRPRVAARGMTTKREVRRPDAWSGEVSPAREQGRLEEGHGPVAYATTLAVPARPPFYLRAPRPTNARTEARLSLGGCYLCGGRQVSEEHHLRCIGDEFSVLGPQGRFRRRPPVVSP